MKKFFIWFILPIVILLSTFKYHLGKIPIVDMYAKSILIYYNEMTISKASSPLLVQTFIFLGAEVNSYYNNNSPASLEMAPLGRHIRTYERHIYYNDSESINELKIINLLLENGARTKGFLTFTKNPIITETLLKHDANIEECEKGEAPLFFHTQYTFVSTSSHYNNSEVKDCSMAEFLISNGADIHTTNEEGKTLLHVASATKLINILINQGLDIEAKDKFGNTPLFYRAKRQNEIRPLKLLIEKGAKINAKNTKGETALEFMLKTNHYSYNSFLGNAEYLLRHGATINDNIYVNSLNIRKPKDFDFHVPNNRGIKLLNDYKELNKEYEYTIHEVVEKMDRDTFTQDGNNKWENMDYLVNMDFIHKLIDSYPKDVSQIKNREGNTPLHYVVKHSVELTKYFINKNVDINAQNNKGETALFFANTLEIAQILVAFGAEVNIKDNKGNSAIDYIKNQKVIKFLTSQGVTLNSKNSLNNLQFISYVKEERSKLKAYSDKDEKYYETIKKFLENGAEVNSKIFYNDESILFYIDNAKLLDLLLDYDVNLEQKDKNGETALSKYLDYPITGIGKLLIKKGANVHTIDKKGRTLLHKVGNEKITKFLLEKGLNINAKDNEGNSPLHTFMFRTMYRGGNTKYETLKLLLNNGVPIDAKNNRGQTALMLAFERNYNRYIKLLRKKGADINQKDAKGNNMLYYALQSKNLKLLQMLLDEGIDINHKNKKGQSVIDYAYEEKVKKMLIERSGTSEISRLLKTTLSKYPNSRSA